MFLSTRQRSWACLLGSPVDWNDETMLSLALWFSVARSCGGGGKKKQGEGLAALGRKRRSG
jgi:hypothetical protein